MFGFFKKEEPKPKKYFIPTTEIRNILELLDKVHATEHNLYAKHVLWTKISKLFPDINFVNSGWEIVSKDSVLHPYVINRET